VLEKHLSHLRQQGLNRLLAPAPMRSQTVTTLPGVQGEKPDDHLMQQTPR